MPGKLRRQPSGLPQLRLPARSKQQYADFIRSAAWIRLSRAIRRQRTVCERCRADLSTEVHHKLTVAAAPHRALDPTNLLAVCAACHDALHR